MNTQRCLAFRSAILVDGSDGANSNIHAKKTREVFGDGNDSESAHRVQYAVRFNLP